MIRVALSASLVAAILGCRAVPLATRRWVGCYEVSSGAWQHEPIQPSPPTSLPDTITLTSRFTRLAADTLGYQLEPRLFDGEQARGEAFWTVSADTVHTTWTDGYRGVRLWFAFGDSGLVGRAEYFTDVVREERHSDGTRRSVPWPSAPVHLRPIRCGSRAAA